MHPDYIVRTNPVTGAVEFIPRNMSTAPEPTFVPSPSSFQRIQPIRVVDNDAPGARVQSMVMRTGANSLERAQQEFARRQDKAIAEGLLDPVTMKWTSDAKLAREVEVAKLSIESARQQVAYCATVEPDLQAQSDELAERVWEDQTVESIAKMNAALNGKPLLSRTVTVEQEGYRDHVVIGAGPEGWPAEFTQPTRIK